MVHAGTHSHVSCEHHQWYDMIMFFHMPQDWDRGSQTAGWWETVSKLASGTGRSSSRGQPQLPASAVAAASGLAGPPIGIPEAVASAIATPIVGNNGTIGGTAVTPSASPKH
jgi:hypothetical protein